MSGTSWPHELRVCSVACIHIDLVMHPWRSGRQCSQPFANISIQQCRQSVRCCKIVTLELASKSESPRCKNHVIHYFFLQISESRCSQMAVYPGRGANLLAALKCLWNTHYLLPVYRATFAIQTFLRAASFGEIPVQHPYAF